jgi:cob(I)alamin adenosyltransferase
MLYTGKGDDGTTKTLNSGVRISKSSHQTEALGQVDELNALLGVVKQVSPNTVAISGLSYLEILSDIQQDLFIIQAQLAGADMEMTKEKVEKLSGWVNAIEAELPPITTFFVSGGTMLAAQCDVARTVSRRVERAVVRALAEHEAIGGDASLLAYLNRLSSVLYALARLANHREAVGEVAPHY